ncbi:hypothetical protein BO226_25955 (plasmid) [Rhodococcus sp. 2G]|uniref:hypothetical protein n=1 Tax=Rhodococcus sp. 2G TaxID=1570939 RepID=UPI00090319A3|nr:hypothetical protein [Rhodococcus sp. 2G]APE12784.1 hypothetical protein BO226_25955 [Rhodococcus sp. 2G]
MEPLLRLFDVPLGLLGVLQQPLRLRCSGVGGAALGSHVCDGRSGILCGAIRCTSLPVEICDEIIEVVDRLSAGRAVRLASGVAEHVDCLGELACFATGGGLLSIGGSQCFFCSLPICLCRRQLGLHSGDIDGGCGALRSGCFSFSGLECVLGCGKVRTSSRDGVGSLAKVGDPVLEVFGASICQSLVGYQRVELCQTPLCCIGNSGGGYNGLACLSRAAFLVT